MQSFNKITLVGFLGKDPELRYTPSGNAVCNFSVATTEKRKDSSGEQVDRTTWFRVTAWGRQAETCDTYLQKGSPVYVEGRMHIETYVDREGNNRSSVEVNASDVKFIGSRGDRGEESPQREEKSSTSAPKPQPRRGANPPIDDDSIPF